MPKRAPTEQAELEAARKRVRELEARNASLEAETDAAQLKDAWGSVKPWCGRNGLAAFYAVADKRGVAWWRARADEPEDVRKARGNAPWRYFYRRSPEDVGMYWNALAELTVGETKFRMARANGGPVVLYVDGKPVFQWGKVNWPPQDLYGSDPLEEVASPAPYETRGLGAPDGLSEQARMLLALASPVQLGALFCELCRTCSEASPQKVPCLHDERLIRALWEDGILHRMSRA